PVLTASAVATPVPKPETPVTGIVQLVSVPDVGVPSIGVTSVGDVANTSDPEPVSFVIVAARLADVAEPRNVAMPALRPVRPPTGRLEQFVRSPEAGTPRAGVTKAGELNVPPVTVFPVKVMAAGSEAVILPETPSPFVIVTSFAVPVMVRLVNVSAAVCVRRPAVESSAASAVSVVSLAWY